jgi:nicotinamidase/pyrazinamidase
VKALILVDLQYDFMPGGALAVPRGDEVVAVANALIARYELVVATRDWHPANHGSFASQHPGKKPGDHVLLDGVDQILWPDHCVQNTRGAELHDDLDASAIDHIVFKGIDPLVDSYSTFFDNARKRATGLEGFLLEKGVREVVLMGLATDYCVLYSALDAVTLGFQTSVVQDGCRGIDLRPGDVAASWQRMRAHGIVLLQAEGVS